MQNRQAVEMIRERKALERQRDELKAREEQYSIDNKFINKFIEKGLTQLEVDTKKKIIRRDKMLPESADQEQQRAMAMV